MISVHLQGRPFSITVIQIYALNSNAEEAEVEQFYEDRQDLLELTPNKDPMEKKCKKAKYLSEEVLQIVVKGRETKSKGEKERYKHLNAEFQRIARRDKKVFLSNQCKK